VAVVEFRTGEQEVPDHLAEMMKGIDTYTMTYDEAIEAMNRKLENDYVSREMNKVVDQHMARLSGRGGLT